MEPQSPRDLSVPLNPEHEIVRKYLETESWKKAGIHPQTGKVAVLKVLKFHLDHCLRTAHEPAES